MNSKNCNDMKRYILFGLSLLMAFPVCVSAQDDTEEEVETVVRVVKKKQKQSETRTISGRVLSATTHQPISGAIVTADNIDGYSVLTEDNGTYELKVPVFTTAVFVTSPDYNPVRMGLQADKVQQDVNLYPSTFQAESERQIDLRGDRAGGREPKHLALAAKHEALGEGDGGAYPGETAGACPHHDAANSFEVELFDPRAVPALPGGPLDVKRLHGHFSMRSERSFANFAPSGTGDPSATSAVS